VQDSRSAIDVPFGRCDIDRATALFQTKVDGRAGRVSMTRLGLARPHMHHQSRQWIGMGLYLEFWSLRENYLRTTCTYGAIPEDGIGQQCSLPALICRPWVARQPQASGETQCSGSVEVANRGMQMQVAPQVGLCWHHPQGSVIRQVAIGPSSGCNPRASLHQSVGMVPLARSCFPASKIHIPAL
jgi:hypothetical protein